MLWDPVVAMESEQERKQLVALMSSTWTSTDRVWLTPSIIWVKFRSSHQGRRPCVPHRKHTAPHSSLHHSATCLPMIDSTSNSPSHSTRCWWGHMEQTAQVTDGADDAVLEAQVNAWGP